LFDTNIVRLKILTFLAWDIEQAGEVELCSSFSVNYVIDYVGMIYINNNNYVLSKQNIKLNIEPQLLEKIINYSNLT
jgi:hypothetical protein